MDFLHGPGGAASVVTLTAMNALKYKIQVPEQVIVLDPNLSESNKAYKVYLEKYKNLVNEDKAPKKVTEVLQHKNPGKSGKIRENPEKSGKISDQGDEDLVFEEVRPEKGALMAARSSSRLALYLLKDESKYLGNIQHSHDYFVVASCKISLQLIEDLQDPIKLEIQPILNNLPNTDHDSDLYNFIKSKGVLGAKIQDIQDLPMLEQLLEQQFVLRVGIVTTRFVTAKNAKSWLLHSYDMKAKTHQYKSNIDWSQLKMVKIKSRPWVKVTGIVNKRILDFFLQAVFCHIMSFPGISVSKIAEHFQPAIQPFHTRELVEYLCQLKGVTMKKFAQKPNVSLFSKPMDENKEMIEATILDEPEDIFVDVTTDGLIRVANYVGKTISKVFQCPCHDEEVMKTRF